MFDYKIKFKRIFCPYSEDENAIYKDIEEEFNLWADKKAWEDEEFEVIDFSYGMNEDTSEWIGVLYKESFKED